MAIESMADTAEVHRHCHAMPLAQHAKESCQRVSVGCTYQEGMEEIGGVISRSVFPFYFQSLEAKLFKCGSMYVLTWESSRCTQWTYPHLVLYLYMHQETSPKVNKHII